MGIKDKGNRAAPRELLEMVERSGLCPGHFARLLGMPRTTLLSMMRGPSAPTGVVLNGARFVLLRLGHAVEIRPITDNFLRCRPRVSKKIPATQRADRTSHAGR